MIIGRIWGGLGNQLFQYAYFYTLTKENELNLMLDTSFYKDQNLRSYRLNLLKIEETNIISETKIPSKIKYLKKKWPNRLIRLFPMYRLNLIGGWKYYKEYKKKYMREFSSPSGNNVYLDGYWQTERYFKKYENEIRQQFSPNYKMDEVVLNAVEEVKKCCSVSVHIRRGDYLKLSRFSSLQVLTESYYRNSIAEMKLKLKKPVFYFFSDDIEWVKSVFSDSEDFQYISVNTSTSDIDELMIMSNCKHHIIANSSFSWWGAWLNPDKDKIVIAPSENFNNEDIIPEEWIKITSNSK